MIRQSFWQLRRPTRWFNALLFYTGWLGLACHAMLMACCWFLELSYPVSWWFTVLAPALCILWGGIPALQWQRETSRPLQARLDC